MRFTKGFSWRRSFLSLAVLISVLRWPVALLNQQRPPRNLRPLPSPLNSRLQRWKSLLRHQQSRRTPGR